MLSVEDVVVLLSNFVMRLPRTPLKLSQQQNWLPSTHTHTHPTANGVHCFSTTNSSNYGNLTLLQKLENACGKLGHKTYTIEVTRNNLTQTNDVFIEILSANFSHSLPPPPVSLLSSLGCYASIAIDKAHFVLINSASIKNINRNQWDGSDVNDLICLLATVEFSRRTHTHTPQQKHTNLVNYWQIILIARPTVIRCSNKMAHRMRTKQKKRKWILANSRLWFGASVDDAEHFQVIYTFWR